ncbi:apolipoprotein N-acyltransferase [Pseudotabrizicola sp. L79]|uniref:apolipoprotein N-acyltransferase n=1 Tax=Pseudotabrizicola sp. L79 TaxID=3118402 RepID=UPI002F935E3D
MRLKPLFAAFPGWRQAGWHVLAGASVALSQAPLLAWYLAFPGLIWALWRMSRAASPAMGWWAGWFVGAGYFGTYLNWIVYPFFVDPWVYGWMAPFAFALMAFGLGLFWAAAAAVATCFPQRLLGLVALLAGVELLRGHIFTGFPWGLVGHLWLGTPVEHMAAYVGATGLTVLTLLAAALPLLNRLWGGAGAAALVAGAMAVGLTQAQAPETPMRPVTLRLVQPAAAQSLKWDPDQARILFQRQLDLTRAGTPADLTIWPETAIPYLFEYSPEVPSIITAASSGKPVAIGIQRVEGEQGWNSLRVVQGAGQVVASYDKHHLVPFGEYMPLGDVLWNWFGIGAFAAQVGNGYSAGPGPAVLDLGPDLGHVLPLICYEAVFPAIPRSVARPDWILQITNDAWFGPFTGPFQHFQLSRLRAIEMGLPLVRVGNTGVTAVIDARGGVVQQLPFAQAGALDVAGLGPALPATAYARYGDLMAWVLLFGLFLASRWPWRRKPG